MEKNNQIELGVVLSYVVLFVGVILSFVYTPILIRLLGQSEYGNYNYVSSIIGYLTLLNFGLGSSYVRFAYKIPKNNIKEIKKLNGTFLILFSILASIVLVLGSIITIFSNQIFAGPYVTNEELQISKVLSIILTINVFVTLLNTIFTSNIIFHERFVFQKILVLIQTVLKPAIIIPILLLGYKSIGVAIVTTLVNVFCFLTNVLYCKIKLKMEFEFAIKDSNFKEIMIFSSFLLLSMIVDKINWSVDYYINGKILGTAAVAIYTVGANLNSLYMSVSEAVSNVFVPKIHRMIANEASDLMLTKMMIKIGRIQFLILNIILSGFIIFGKSFIFLWVGNDYIMAYYIIILLMVPVTIPQIQKIGLEIQKAKNRHKFRSVMYSVIAIANVIISIPLCKWKGPLGTAIGTFITVLVGNGIIMNWYYNRIGINISMFWREIARMGLKLGVPFIIFFAIFQNRIIDNWLKLILFIIIYTLVYFLISWCWVLNNEEKIKIKEILHINS